MHSSKLKPPTTRHFTAAPLPYARKMGGAPPPLLARSRNSGECRWGEVWGGQAQIIQGSWKFTKGVEIIIDSTLLTHFKSEISKCKSNKVPNPQTPDQT